MTPARAEAAHSDPAASPADAAERAELSRRVREALDGLPARERRLLLLRAEGYRYRDIALALELNEASVGTLLARAKRAFRVRYESRPDAS
jgi:RNA polymerase sigma-70 factor (ECF subfamily)